MRRKIVIWRIIIGFSLIACICQAQNSQAPSCGQNHFTRPDDPRRIAAGGGDGLSGANSDNNGAQLGAWPWMVSAGYKLTGAEPWEHVCGGSLVSDRHVLTSAHCTIDSRLQLRLGDSNLASPLDDLGAKVRTISRTVLHPSYAAGSRSAYYDLAVWEFRPPLNTFNDYISPVCLPDQASRDQNKNEGSHVSVVGWGLRARNDPNRDALLRHAPIRIFSQEWCNITHSGSLPLNIQEAVRALVPDLFQSNVMCAGSDYGVYGSCKGDSGSPLIRLYTTNGRPRYVQLGLVQGGVGRCGDTRYPSIYVRLDDPEVLDFVQETIGLKKTRPPENKKPSVEDDNIAPHDGDFNFRGPNGETHIFALAQNGYYNETKLLLDHGGNPDLPNNDNWTPLIAATINGHLDIVRLLLMYNADTSPRSSAGRTALSYASIHGHLDIAKELVRSGANLNTQDDELDSPLMLATYFEAPAEVSLYLIAQGADLHLVNLRGRSALHHACMRSPAEVVQRLIRKGADVNLRDVIDAIPFSLACGFGNDEVVRYMLRAGYGNTSAQDKDDDTPLTVAADRGHDTVVGLLLRYSTKEIDWKNSDGYTALHLAAKKGHYNIVEALIRSGANKSVRISGNGATPKELAMKNEHYNVANLL